MTTTPPPDRFVVLGFGRGEETKVFGTCVLAEPFHTKLAAQKAMDRLDVAFPDMQFLILPITRTPQAE